MQGKPKKKKKKKRSKARFFEEELVLEEEKERSMVEAASSELKEEEEKGYGEEGVISIPVNMVMSKFQVCCVSTYFNLNSPACLWY